MNIIPNNTTENLTEAQTRRIDALDRAMLITPLMPPPAQLAARIMHAARVRAQRKSQPAITPAQLVFLVGVSGFLLVGMIGFVGVRILAQGGWNPVSLAHLFATMSQDLSILVRALASVGRAILTKPIVWFAIIGIAILVEASLASVLGVAFARNKK